MENALMWLPNVLEMHVTPDGFSRKEWKHKRRDGSVDHYRFVQVRSGPLLHRCMTNFPNHTGCSLHAGVFELFVQIERYGFGEDILGEEMNEAKRPTVNYRFDALNWDFIRLMAEVAKESEEKHGSPEQFTNGRLEGDKSPVNHVFEHMSLYIAGKREEHFGTVAHHLAKVAYNAMMEYYYLMHGGGPTVFNALYVDRLTEGTFNLASKLKKEPEKHFVTPYGASLEVKLCTREANHDGPCNGWPTKSCTVCPK